MRRAEWWRRRSLGSHALLVTPFGEFLQHLAVERRDVCWLAAGDQPLIHMDFFIHPVASGILDIRFQRRPRGHRPAAKDVGFAQSPRTMAYGGHGLLTVKK